MQNLPRLGSTPYLLRYISAKPNSIIISPAGILIYGAAFGRRRGDFDAEAAAHRALGESARRLSEDSGLVGGATGAKRREISTWTAPSRRRFVRYLVDLVPAILAAQVDDTVAFISLTYGREAPRAAASKRHFDAWVHHRLARDHPAAALVWVWEVQKRGAPHFHALLFLPDVLGETFESWATESWIGVTGLGGSKEAHRHRYAVDVRKLDSDQMIALGIVAYLVKELAKSRSKARPDAVAVPGRGPTVPLFDADHYPGRFWGWRNKERLRELRAVHPSAPLRDLAPAAVPVVCDRLRVISTARIPDELAYRYAELRGEERPPFWRVGFDHLGVPGRYLESGDPVVLETIIRASRRHHCGRYGANGLELWHRDPDGRTLRAALEAGEIGGHWDIPPAQLEMFSRSPEEFLAAYRREDFRVCSAFYPSPDSLIDRYPAAAQGQLAFAS